MTNKKVGAPPKFGKTKTAVLRISRVVPQKELGNYKKECAALFNRLQSESLSKCADEALKSNEDGDI